MADPLRVVILKERREGRVDSGYAGGRVHGGLGGPHVMTCDTSMLHGRGVSFALAEAELVWREILEDAVGGELRSCHT